MEILGVWVFLMGEVPRFDGSEIHGLLNDVEVVWEVQQLWVHRLQERPRLFPRRENVLSRAFSYLLEPFRIY